VNRIDGKLRTFALLWTLFVLTYSGFACSVEQVHVLELGCHLFERDYWSEIGPGSILLEEGRLAVQEQPGVPGPLGALGTWRISRSDGELLSASVFFDKNYSELVFSEMIRCGGVKGVATETVVTSKDGAVMSQSMTKTWYVHLKGGDAAYVTFTDDGNGAREFERIELEQVGLANLRIDWPSTENQ